MENSNAKFFPVSKLKAFVEALSENHPEKIQLLKTYLIEYQKNLTKIFS